MKDENISFIAGVVGGLIAVGIYFRQQRKPVAGAKRKTKKSKSFFRKAGKNLFIMEPVYEA